MLDFVDLLRAKRIRCEQHAEVALSDAEQDRRAIEWAQVLVAVEHQRAAEIEVAPLVPVPPRKQLLS